MITNIRYTNIRRVLDELKRHPLLQDITLEQVVSYLVTFIGIFGMPKMYEDKEIEIDIKDYRGELPCDLVSVTQVKDCKTGQCFRSMTDSFTPKGNKSKTNGTFKTQGKCIFASMKEGKVLMAYKSIPVDDEGYPLLIENSVFLKAFEQYVKKEVFTILFDLGKIGQAVLQNSQQQYAWLAAQLDAEFIIPSVSEMESITNMLNTLIPRTREFEKGFESLGDKEYIKRQ